MDDLGRLLELAVDLAEQAGRLLLDRRSGQRGGLGTKSSDTDMVSDQDRASEALIVEGLRRARPDDGVEAEEGGGRAGTSGVRWVIDPLDGTTNYLYGYPCFAVSIAAEVDGRAAVGVVADPVHGDLFSAARGQGATRNGEPIRHSGQDDLTTALVGTGFSYLPEQRERQAKVLTTVLPAVRDVRRAGAASLDLCWVACGRLDGYYEGPLQPWDIAAGVLIAEEAGARTCDLNGGPPTAEFVVAAAPGLAEPLRTLLLEAGAPGG